MAGTYTPLTVVRAKEDVASCALGEGSALLDLERSQYFSLNSVAADLWDKMQKPVTVAELTQFIGEQYDAAEHDISADINCLLDELERLQLIQIEHA